MVESATARSVFTAPAHPYTKKLMRATPRPGASLHDLLPEEDAAAPAAPASPAAAVSMPMKHGAESAPLLVVEKLVKEYPRKGAGKSLRQIFGRKPPTEPETFRAVDGISFVVHRGESVGLVGESGCGKSTTSTMVMRLIDKTDGVILFDGQDIGAIPARQFARLPLRKRIQMVFQDPTDSLNPRFTAARAIADPLLRLGNLRGRDAVRARCEELARQVGLPVALIDRFPHQLSGGQKARVGIARAIALNPDLAILDEPTAALDVSVQAVVLNLLQELKQSLGMSYLFVSHDLNVVRLLCDRVIVMRAGRIVEQGATEAGLVGAAGTVYARSPECYSASAIRSSRVGTAPTQAKPAGQYGESAQGKPAGQGRASKSRTQEGRTEDKGPEEAGRPNENSQSAVGRPARQLCRSRRAGAWSSDRAAVACGHQGQSGGESTAGRLRRRISLAGRGPTCADFHGLDPPAGPSQEACTQWRSIRPPPRLSRSRAP